jgi:hypothetical protein
MCKTDTRLFKVSLVFGVECRVNSFLSQGYIHFSSLTVAVKFHLQGQHDRVIIIKPTFHPIQIHQIVQFRLYRRCALQVRDHQAAVVKVAILTKSVSRHWSTSIDLSPLLSLTLMTSINRWGRLTEWCRDATKACQSRPCLVQVHRVLPFRPFALNKLNELTFNFWIIQTAWSQTFG